MSMIQVRINGVPTTQARFGRAAIHGVLGPSPNTGRLTFSTAPVEGQPIAIALITESPERLLFAGQIQTVTEGYDLKSTNSRWDAQLIDPTFAANRRRPIGAWVNTSATTVALAIAAAYAPDCTTGGIAGGLEPITINFDGSEPFMSALQRIAQMIGCRATLNYANDLGLFLVDPYEAPDPIDDTHPPLNEPPIAFSVDLAPVRTRLLGKGHDERLLSDVLAGETILPLPDTVMFGTIGGMGRAIVGTTDGSAQTQLVSYTGVTAGGGGSLVGPGIGPSTAMTLAIAAGAGVESGVHQYAYTFVTASGESLPSPLATITPGTAVADPVGAPTLQNSTNHAFGAPWAIGDSIFIVVTYLNTFGETVASTASNTIIAAQSFGSFPLDIDAPSLPVSSDPSVSLKKIYVKVNGAWAYSGTLGNANTNRYNLAQNGVITASAAAPPGSNTTAGNRVNLSGIALGPSGTTSRKVYRTAANAAQLKLQQTIANNTATTGTQDSTADASLGANVPTSDTSGLTQATGQVNAGSTSAILASAGPFVSGGGWAIAPGGELIRYTGISGNTLTGIPASGPGAILTTLRYGATLTPAPALTGVSALSGSVGMLVACAKGSTVAIWVQRDDYAAQTALAALEAEVGMPTETLFTSSGTFVVPSASITIECWGGGGGGGAFKQSGVNRGGGGGGGGSYGRVTVTGLTLGSSLAVTVGAGGAGGAFVDGVSWANGATGGTSSVAAYVTATGGVGGLAGSTGGAGGTASGSGATVFAGGAGGAGAPNGSGGLNTGGGGGGGGGTTAAGSAGAAGTNASSNGGVGGAGGVLDGGAGGHGQASGSAGTTPGGGGGGGSDASGGTPPGLDGARGLVRLTYDAPVGVREDHFFDGRLAEATLIAACDAKLAQFSHPIVGVTYGTLDPKTRAGATVTINLSARPDGAGDYTIQMVDTTFMGRDAQPRFRVQAASVAFTLMDLLRLTQLSP